MAQWEKIDSKVIFEHPRIVLVEDTVILPNREESKYLRMEGRHFVDFPTIIARRDDGRIMVTEEYAYPSNKVLNQFPEGAADEGESMETAAAREFLEETGFVAKQLRVIGSCLHEHRRSACMQYTVLATGLTQEAEPQTEAEEGEIIVSWLTEDEIWQLIADGKIIQKNALAAWSIYQAHKRQAAN